MSSFVHVLMLLHFFHSSVALRPYALLSTKGEPILHGEARGGEPRSWGSRTMQCAELWAIALFQFFSFGIELLNARKPERVFPAHFEAVEKGILFRCTRNVGLSVCGATGNSCCSFAAD